MNRLACELHPEREAFDSGLLEAGGGHRVYWEQSGSPGGVPVIFLHGGPGSGCAPKHRRYFHPQHYRAVIFDQRGAGRSGPPGELRDNTTQALVADMERIREHLRLPRWLLFGGSWGATLALVYARAHPERVSGMILRGSFLARACDLEWFVGGGVQRIFPDHWQAVLQELPERERDRPMQALVRHILHGDEPTQRRLARVWADWSSQVVCYNLALPEASVEPPVEQEDEERRLHQARIEMHYAHHRYFLQENEILNHAAQLPRVPTVLIHGRRDLTCPLSASWDLHRALPASELIIVPEAGHLAGEPAMTRTLVQVATHVAETLRGG